jgi:hypothetical protein
MHRGRSITALMDELGHTGLCFFLIQEMCAEKLEKRGNEKLTEEDCVFSFHRKVIQQLLRLRPVGIDRLLVSCSSAGLLQYVATEDEIIIKMPILLNLLDRDSRRARSTRVRDAQRARLDKEEEEERECAPRARAAQPLSSTKKFELKFNEDFKKFEEWLGALVSFTPMFKNRLPEIYEVWKDNKEGFSSFVESRLKKAKELGVDKDAYVRSAILGESGLIGVV